MTKRRDTETTVVQFFTDAPPETALTVFRIVRGIVDARGLLKLGAARTTTVTKRRTRINADAAPTES